MDLANYMSVLAGLDEKNLSGQPSEDASNFVALRWLCNGLYEARESELYRGDGSIIARSPQYRSASLVSTPSSSKAVNYANLLTKVSLYSDLVIFVLPVELQALETSYSAPGIVRDFDVKTVRYVVDLNRQYGDLVSAGKCVFLPRRLGYIFGSTSEDTSYGYTPPLGSSRHPSPYIPFNHRLRTKHLRELLMCKQILLPYFPDLDFLRIAKLRDEETDSFIRFSTYLRRRTRDLAMVDSTQQIDELIEEIEYEVAGLRIEAQKLQQGRVLRDAKLALFAVSIGAISSLGSAAAASVAGVAGSVSALELLKEWTDRKKAAIDLKKSDFYIPYLLTDEMDNK